MFLTLTRGNGLMRAATDLSPRERYEVVGYIRDEFMKDSNPDYRPVTYGVSRRAAEGNRTTANSTRRRTATTARRSHRNWAAT